MIVVDASVLATALGDDGDDGTRAREAISGEQLFAPELIDLEVLSVWRRARRSDRMSTRRAGQAITDLERMPLRRAPHRMLIPRIWELSNNVTSYDAAYVALAEALSAPLLTADSALSRAPGLHCTVLLIS